MSFEDKLVQVFRDSYGVKIHNFMCHILIYFVYSVILMRIASIVFLWLLLFLAVCFCDYY